MKQNYTLMGGKAWCCFSVFYSRKAWGSLLTEVVSFYREFQSLFHYFWLISLNNKENISKSLFRLILRIWLKYRKGSILIFYFS